MHRQSDDIHSLQEPLIDWREDGTPVSRCYDDLYHSSTDGLEETRYVFLSRNDLQRRWAQLPPESAHFIIIETGFGTGLNFLATWQLWNQQRKPGQQLHYVSIEKHPLASDDIARANLRWPELAPLSECLLASYPPRLPGIHPVQVEPSVHLTLCFGDVAEMLQQLCDCAHPALMAATSFKADAWFLDGFAPARNAAMWSDRVFTLMSGLSGPDTTFATFTAAGQVRRGLQAAGFEVRKVPGFGQKRDMLCGHFGVPPAPPPVARGERPGHAWHCSPHHHSGKHSALVIGAGLAGCHTAAALAASGWQVTVWESDQDVACAASGNPSGLLYSRLSPARAEQTDFYLYSYLSASRHYRQCFENGALVAGRDGELSGLLQLGFNPRERQQLELIAARFKGQEAWVEGVSAEQASSLSGLELDNPALYFPCGGWLSPRQVCRQLLDHPAIRLQSHTMAQQLHYRGDAWEATSSGGRSHTASICIVCSGLQSRDLEQLSWLPTRPVAGQITFFELEGSRPRIPLCHDGYVAPKGDGSWCCGASFRVNDDRDDLRETDHRQNLNKLARHIPALLTSQRAAELGATTPRGRAAVRCTTPDYLPVVGPVPDLGALRARFGALARDAHTNIPEPGQFLPGLYVNTGHGSRGLSTTPIAASLLAALINRTPRPLPWQLVRALSPARFPIRQLIKGTTS